MDVVDDERGGRLLVWGLKGMEAGTIEQARKTARLPFVRSHLALMPDAHVGIGATIGSVIATDGAIVPAAVGVDIGCGMIAAPTELSSRDLPDDLRALHSAIAEVIPAGVGQGHATGAPRSPGLVDQGLAAADGSEIGQALAARLLSTRNARIRQPLRRGMPRRDGSRVAVAPLRFSRESETRSRSVTSTGPRS